LAERLHIAQVATSGMAVQVLLLDQIRALEDAGYDVTAVCAPGRWAEQARTSGIRVETVDFSREPSPIKDMRALRQLCSLFNRNRYDVIHSHTPKAGILAPLAARLTSAPHVVHTVHGFLFHDQMPKWKQILPWTLEKFTATLTHQLLSQSREDVGTAIQRRLCRADKILYLGNGIDVLHFCPTAGEQRRFSIRESLGVSHEDVLVGAVGRLVYEKGFAELFLAAEELIHKHPRLHFLMIGGHDEGQNDSIPHQVVERVRASGRVHFLGWQQKMTGWYKAMDLFVLPSHREGIPRACMEASAMEIPVVATDIRGCREVVKHGETGLLVPMRDPTKLSHAIEQLAADPGLRRAMGNRGRRHMVQNFDRQQVLERLLNFYAQIVPLPREVAAACATS